MEIKKKGRGGLIAFLCIILCIALVFTGLGYPGFALGAFKDKPSYSYLSNKKEQPEEAGDSKAFKITPVEGMTIEAEKNALDKDREFKVNRVKEFSMEMVYADNYLLDQGAVIIDAYDVDAGLAPDEHLPGEYSVTLELDKLGIAPENYENIRVYRIASNEEVYEYVTELEGNKLTYTTDQNSIVAIAFAALGICTVYRYAVEGYEQTGFYSRTTYTVCSREVNCLGGSFRLVWLPENIGIKDKLDRLMDIRNKYMREASLPVDEEYLENLYNADSGLAVYQKRKDIVPEVNKKLEEDAEYQKLLSELSEAENADITCNLIKKAYEYIWRLPKAKLPRYRVGFFFNPTTDNEGEAVAPKVFRDPYINLRCSDVEGEFSKNNQDNMLITITHELFHLCQNRYRLTNSLDNIMFDEATAVTIENDAYKYFTESGDITTDISNLLTDTNYFCTMVIPMDGDGLFTDKNALRHEGYTYYRFIQYLREKTGKNPQPTELMANGSYFTTTTVSKPLKLSFELSDKELSDYYTSFCVDTKADFWQRFRTFPSYPFDGKITPKMVTLKKDEANYIEVKPVDYAAEMKMFFAGADIDNYALLLSPRENLASTRPEFSTLPLGENGVKNTNHGLFYPVSNDAFRYIMEIHGKSDPGWFEDATGYDAWVLTPPEAPETELDKGVLKVTLPEASAAAKAGVVDGIRLSIVSGSQVVTKFYKVSACGKTKKIKIDTPSEGEGDVTFSISVSEYVKDDKGKKYFGPESNQDSLSAELDDLLAQAGALQGDITISMIWHTHDDMDLHLVTPNGEIYYGNRTLDGGELDVDMNVYESSCSDSPIENIYVNNPVPGHYRVYVDNFADRTEGVDTDVMVRVTIGGVQKRYDLVVGSRADVMEFDYGTPEAEEDEDADK